MLLDDEGSSQQESRGGMTIKLPEPGLSWKHEDIHGDEVGPATPYYTHDQLVQAVRDALEEAAKECGYHHTARDCFRAIRAMKEGIQS